MARIILPVGLLILFGVLFFSARSLTKSYQDLPLEIEEVNQDYGIIDWKDYEAPSKHFRVSMPQKPEFGRKNFVDSLTGEKRVYEMAIAHTLDNTLYMVNVVHFIERRPDETDNLILRDLLNDMVKAKPDNKLTELQMEPYLGYDGMDFRIENPDTVMKGKAFVKDDVAYVLTVVGRPPFDEVNDYLFFINSFQIVPE